MRPRRSPCETRFAFFLDHARTQGGTRRLWLSNGGSDFTLAAAFPTGGSSVAIEDGTLEEAPASSPVLAKAATCSGGSSTRNEP